MNKHITLTGHVYSPLVFLFSKKIFDTYSKKDQELIKQYIAKVSKRTIEITKATEANYLKQIKDSGCNVITLTSAEKDAFRKTTKPVMKLIEEKAGSTMVKMLQSELKK